MATIIAAWNGQRAAVAMKRALPIVRECHRRRAAVNRFTALRGDVGSTSGCLVVVRRSESTAERRHPGRCLQRAGSRGGLSPALARTLPLQPDHMDLVRPHERLTAHRRP